MGRLVDDNRVGDLVTAGLQHETNDVNPKIRIPTSGG
jgi:hypothetical protein